MQRLPARVVSAVSIWDSGWLNARKPSRTVSASLRRHEAILAGRFEPAGQTSDWFASQGHVDLSAYVAFHSSPVFVRRWVARVGVLEDPRPAATLMTRVGIVQRGRGMLA
eukprot:256557-Alexandrium_andersonii.AAC.1